MRQRDSAERKALRGSLALKAGGRLLITRPSLERRTSRRAEGGCATLGQRCAGYWKVTKTASVRFEVMVGFMSRYQAWKYHVSPG